MKRFLVIGCGGSGGATLAYMMDQLRSDLGTSLPAGWQFVHIDVPTGEEAGPEGLSNVQGQGGDYVACGPHGGSYPTLDIALAGQPRLLPEIATWAPRKAAEISIPIDVGAGQYRAIGRMILLSRTQEVSRTFNTAWSRLQTVEAGAQLTRIAAEVPGVGLYNPADPPVILVVSSMAGGAGASMALDVCRLLTLVPGVNPNLIGVFMYSADVFDELPAGARQGVRGNALAMAGEIIASQSGAAREHDQAIFAAMGLNTGHGVTPPFARVFPISQRVGMDRTPFGDGSARTVYRGLARGLSALMMSGSASTDFVSYDLGNETVLPADRNVFGWGNSNRWAPMQWGSFGYACLSTGRERFREYAAQRIASGAVDRLAEGHLVRGNNASSNEQVRALLDSQWQFIAANVRLPVHDADFGHWLVGAVFPGADRDAHEIAAVELGPNVSSPAGQRAPQFLEIVARQIAERRDRMLSAATGAAYRRAYAWQLEIAEATKAAVGDGIARFGIAYGIAIIDRVESTMRDIVAPNAADSTQRGPADVAALPPDAANMLAGNRGVVANAQQVVGVIVDSFRNPLRAQILAHGCRLLEQFVPAFVAEFLAPLRRSLQDALQYVELVRDPARSPIVDQGLARLATDQYQAWPKEDDEQVPARFTHALNEVLLIKASDFGEQFEHDLTAALGAQRSAAYGRSATIDYAEARSTVLYQVISDDWQTTGSDRPARKLLEQTAHWRTRVFATDPSTNESFVPQDARFDVHVRPVEVLDRARMFVDRPGESFERFVSTSLRELLDQDDAEARKAAVQGEVVAAFVEALGRAKPLISVDRGAVAQIHAPETVHYRYKFSDIPYGGHAIAGGLRFTIPTNPDIDPLTVDAFDRALRGSESDVTRIDIFGSYANFSPVVFDAVLRSSADEWSGTPAAGKGPFWRLRRSRPLPASLPMGDVERHAMVAGWFVGQVTGQLRIPSAPFSHQTGPVEIWDAENARWLSFPYPLLTPPTAFLAEYDFLPAVLESSLLALAQANQPPLFASLRPYQLLRSLWDDSPDEPMVEAAFNQFVAERYLIAWLETGATVSGEPSRVPSSAQARSSSERLENLIDWLAAINELAGRDYLSSADGAPGGGVFATITQRRQAGATPLFRDVAGDVFRVTDELRNLARQAQARVQSGGGAAGAPGADPGLAPPSAGVSF